MNIKKLISILTASAVMALSSVSVFATDNGTRSYDINNKEYAIKIDKLGNSIYKEQELLDYFNNKYNSEMEQAGEKDFMLSPYKHIYGKTPLSFVMESGNDSYRTFSSGFMLLDKNNFMGDDHRYQNNDELVEKYTIEEINDFLTNEGLKSYIEEKEDSNGISYQMCYDDNSIENVIDTFLAMNSKYGAIAQVIYLTSNPTTYYNEDDPVETTPDITEDTETTTTIVSYPTVDQTVTTPIVSYPTITDETIETYVIPVKVGISGDADGDGTPFTTADAVILSKYIANPSAYDFSPEQIAGADVNGDSSVNADDLLDMIEYVIGKKTK